MIYFFTYLPYIFISLRYESLNLVAKISSCFISNLAMCLGIQLIGIVEGQGKGINFENLMHGSSISDPFSLMHIMVVMVLNNLIHILLTYYFDNVIQGDHGISKPWYFMFSSKRQTKNFSDIKMLKNESSDTFVENESIYANKKVGVKIENLGKTFQQLGVTKNAVKNLCLNVYEGHITVLLGKL